MIWKMHFKVCEYNGRNVLIHHFYSTDVYSVSDVFSFSAFERRSCTPLLIVDDILPESLEEFLIFLLRTANLDKRIKLDPSPGKIFIEDNDGSCYQVCLIIL